MSRFFVLLILAATVTACSGPPPAAAQEGGNGDDEIVSHPRSADEANSEESPQITSQELLKADTQYTNSDYGFSLQLPEGLYVQESTNPSLVPAPLLEVNFYGQSPDIQAQIPELTVRVFSIAKGQDLQLWLDEQGVAKRFGSKVDVVPYTVSGLQGLRVTSVRMMAPRSAVYVVSGEYVFELTPLGQAGEEMLGSLALEG